MKIDLHCHTKQIKSGDGSGRNVTKELFCRKIFDADVKIVAITNHNSFDKEQFCDFKDAVSENCQLLYKDVCKEYIAELNKELVQVKNSIKKELQ